MPSPLILAIDVGTGSARAAVVDREGTILAIRARPHEQIVPRFAWSEQRPAEWWAGTVGAIRDVLADIEGARERIAAVAACGQMHGTVLIDEAGALTRETAPLWNDKRTADYVSAFEAAYPDGDYLPLTGNPPTTAWPGFKLQWLRDHDPDAYARARSVLMPKDYINFRLTGERAMDPTEAAASFLMNPTTGTWEPRILDRLGLDRAKLVDLKAPTDWLGAVTAVAAEETGLRAGTPVVVGAGDFPAALLGSGCARPGIGSVVLGTSAILTVVNPQPILDLELSTVGTVEGGFGSFVLLESGGDAMRWARRALHDNALDYPAIVDKAAEAPAGADGLFFLPYLTGERFGRHRNARAQFFGLAAGHGLAHLHRAVMEGVAFAVTRHARIMEARSGTKLTRVIASGGGAKTALWLKIQASAYGIPIAVPKEAECGVIGCAAMALTALGHHADVASAADALIRYEADVLPDPVWAERYHRMQPVFDRIYQHSQALYDDLDRLMD